MSKERDDFPGQASRLDAIPTQASMLGLALQGDSLARETLVMRYRKAIRRYLGALLKDDHDADEVAQEVLMKLLRGDFAGVDPERGRFRNYLKTAVRNAALTHLRKQSRTTSTDPELLDPADPASAGEDDWLVEWRRQLLDLTWAALEAYQHQTPGNVFHTVMRLVTERPEDDSIQLAARLSDVAAKKFNAVAARKQLSRARRKFAELLVEEVKKGLLRPTMDEVLEELAEVGLMPYVQGLISTKDA
jgi:RNA polymerase sigma-70 factor (ECF subfamily)